MKALVTGGAGFVGSHVVRALLKQGRDVRVLCLPGEDVADVAAGHLLAEQHGKTGERYLLGNRNLSFRELASMIMDVTGVRKPIAVVPHRVARLGGRIGVRWARHFSGRAPMFTPATIDIAKLGLRADCTKAVNELELPQTPIRDALSDAMKWFETGAVLDLSESGADRTTMVDSALGIRCDLPSLSSLSSSWRRSDVLLPMARAVHLEISR